jgi:hypothetical protein
VRKSDQKPSAYQKMSKKIVSRTPRSASPPVFQDLDAEADGRVLVDGLALIRDYMGSDASAKGHVEDADKKKPRKRRRAKPKKPKSVHHE